MSVPTRQPTVADAKAQPRTLTIVEAVREALRQEMERDERVVILGEDVGQLGGVFRATDGLLARFGPGRVVDTPMMELGIAGLAVGMAMRGLRPVAEIQFADFMHAAADHVISDAARIRFRTNGDAACPLVIRTAYGGGLRGGPYHSQSVEAYYAHVSGLRVVTASFASDAKGLLTAAIRHADPVLFLEHKRTYRAVRDEVPEGEYVLSLDHAHVVRPGRDVTVVAWGWVLHEALAAAAQLASDGVEVEVIDPRTLNPIDSLTLLESVRRTGRLCVVHEDTLSMGVGAELAALAAEHALDDLRAPVERVAMADVAGIPASGPMEDFLIPDRVRIAEALRRLSRIDRSARVNGRGFEAAVSAAPAAPAQPVPAQAVSAFPAVVNARAVNVGAAHASAVDAESANSGALNEVAANGSRVDDATGTVAGVDAGGLDAGAAYAAALSAPAANASRVDAGNATAEALSVPAAKPLRVDAGAVNAADTDIAPLGAPSAVPTWSELLEASNRDIPQAASVVEIDLSRAARRLGELRAAWADRGMEAGFTPLFVEALLAALRRVPQANAAFDASAPGIYRYSAVHLGLSVSSLDGESARHAVVIDADTRNLLGLAMEVQRVRSSGVCQPDVLAQATVSLADYGPGSALFGVPQVLPGQVAAVRIGEVEQRLVTRDTGFAVVPTAYVCASIDHRALDGMDAGALLGEMKRFLEAEG